MNLPGHIIGTLCDDFFLVELQQETFSKYFDENFKKPFGDRDYLIHIHLLFDEEEKAKQNKLAARMGDLFKLHWGIFTKSGEFIGWHRGDQKSAEEYYMRSSAILPEYQGHGIYSAMLPIIIDRCRKEGFQVLSSLHNFTNNRVIVPKLKAGFIIAGTQVVDKYGTLVILEYYANEKRREILDFRCGAMQYQAEWDGLRK